MFRSPASYGKTAAAPDPGPLIKTYTSHVTLNSPQQDYRRLLDAIGEANVVCIGDGSHGTEEFYRERAYITQLLIHEKGFNLVCTESDWPDSYTINRYVHDQPSLQTDRPVDALRDFSRFPLWMWRNDVMVPFIKWMRDWNRQQQDSKRKVGYYGMDVYSLHSSMDAVIQYLEKVDPKAAKLARERYGCFERFGEDTSTYAFTTRYGLAKGCADEALKVLTDLLKQSHTYAALDAESAFVAEMNAMVVRDAEEYYRLMLDEDVRTWNLRDTHMVETVERLREYRRMKDGMHSPVSGTQRRRLSPEKTNLGRAHPPLGCSEDGVAKVVIWAHNSHLGDARYTDMGRRRGEMNVGQLCRERFGQDNVFNIGFTTFTGTVTAAHQWDTPAVLLRVKKARDDSWEALLTKELGEGVNGLIITHRIQNGKKVPVDPDLVRALNQPERLERFIGVIYKPMTERWSHYSSCQLGSQFDALVHLYSSNGIRPLDTTKDFPDASEDVSEVFPASIEE